MRDDGEKLEANKKNKKNVICWTCGKSGHVKNCLGKANLTKALN